MQQQTQLKFTSLVYSLLIFLSFSNAIAIEKENLKIQFDGCTPNFQSLLKESTLKAVNYGLQCFKRFGDKNYADQILKTLNQNQLTYMCRLPGLVQDVVGKKSNLHIKLYPTQTAISLISAFKHTKGQELFPGILFNYRNIPLETMESTIFHEMLHWGGHLHGQGVEIAYLAEVCCYEKKNEALKQKACELMNLKDTNNVDYQKNLPEILLHNGVPAHISMENAFLSINAPSNTSKDASAALEGLIVSSNLYNKPLSAFILGKSLYSFLPRPDHKKIRQRFEESVASHYLIGSEKEEFIDIFSNIIKFAFISDDQEKLAHEIDRFKKLDKEKFCGELSTSELADIREVQLFFESTLKVNTLFKQDSDLFEEWKGLCIGVGPSKNQTDSM